MSSGYYRSLRIPVTPGRFRHSTALSPTRPPYPSHSFHHILTPFTSWPPAFGRPFGGHVQR